MWVVRSVKLTTGKQSKRWVRVTRRPNTRKPTKPPKRKLSSVTRPPKKSSKSTKRVPKSTKRTPKSMKHAPKSMKHAPKSTKRTKKVSKAFRGGADSDQARIAQMICDVLRLYIPVYAFTTNKYTIDTFRLKLENMIRGYTLDRGALVQFGAYANRARAYSNKYATFTAQLKTLSPHESVQLREVFTNKKNRLESQLATMARDVKMVLDPEAYYGVLRDIGCEKAKMVDVVSKYYATHSTTHPDRDSHYYEFMSR